MKINLWVIAFALLTENALALTSGSCGTGCSYTLDDNGLLTVTGSGENASIKAGAFERVSSITKVVIQGTISSIGHSAFNGCANMQEITLPNSIRTISSHAFSYSPKLTSIDIPEGVEVIGQRTFLGTGIKNLVLPSTLKNIGGDNFRYVLDSIMVMSNKATLASNFPNAKEIYCLNTSNCAEWLKNTSIDLSKIKTFSLKGNEYWLDGKKYESVENLQLGKNTPIRIYTVEEATWLTQQNKGKNTFTLKYR